MRQRERDVAEKRGILSCILPNEPIRQTCDHIFGVVPSFSPRSQLQILIVAQVARILIMRTRLAQIAEKRINFFLMGTPVVFTSSKPHLPKQPLL